MWWGLRWLEGRLSWDTSDHSAHLPSPQKLSESRGEELEQLDPNPVPHSSLFSDIIESWNGLVRRTTVSAQPCPSAGGGELRNSPLGCYLTVLSFQKAGVEAMWHHPGTLWTRIFFLFSKHQLSFLNPSISLLLLSKTMNNQSHFLLIKSLSIIINLPANGCSLN